MITKDLIELQSLVRRILTKNLPTRDNDILLMNAIWEYQNKNIKFISYDKFIYQLSKGFLFAPESIRRARQKVQELNPETRGVLYYERRGQQEEVKAVLEFYKKEMK